MKGSSVILFVAFVAVIRGQVEQCPTEQETDWEIEMLLRHEDCNKFYMCTFGQPVEFSCFGDLYFNLETWQCDWRENVDCSDRIDPALTTLAPTTLVPTTIPPTTTTTTLAPTTTTTTTTTTAPPPTTTTTTTTTTTPAPTTTTTTPAPTTTTTTPAPTTTTTTTTTTTPPPTTTTTTTLAPTTTTTTTTEAPECEIEISPQPTESPEEENDLDFLLNGCPVDPHIHWLLPNEEDCNLFYYCVWGEKVLRQCAPTLYFNPILQVCDWPQNAGCKVSANKHAEARRQLLNQILL